VLVMVKDSNARRVGLVVYYLGSPTVFVMVKDSHAPRVGLTVYYLGSPTVFVMAPHAKGLARFASRVDGSTTSARHRARHGEGLAYIRHSSLRT
jgi:hypothetical protein